MILFSKDNLIGMRAYTYTKLPNISFITIISYYIQEESLTAFYSIYIIPIVDVVYIT
jgi:hypothetical protein